MAVDTRSRRASVLGLGLAVLLTPPLADGAVGTEDRAHVALCYAGLTTASPPTATLAPAWRTVRVPADNRVVAVPSETRTARVPAERRTQEVI